MKESVRFPQGCKIKQENDRLYLPKIGWIRYRNSREVLGEIKNVTVSQKCGRFFMSIQTEFEQEIPTHKGGEIGIDMGVVRFTTLSNGEFFAPLNAFKTDKVKLAKLQRRLKNKVKFSQNWQKLKEKISELHHKITNCRKNFCTKPQAKSAKTTRWFLSKICKWKICQPPQKTQQKHTAKANRETQAHFECVECGYAENADVFGAINVLARGRAVVQA